MGGRRDTCELGDNCDLDDEEHRRGMIRIDNPVRTRDRSRVKLKQMTAVLTTPSGVERLDYPLDVSNDSFDCGEYHGEPNTIAAKDWAFVFIAKAEADELVLLLRKPVTFPISRPTLLRGEREQVAIFELSIEVGGEINGKSIRPKEIKFPLTFRNPIPNPSLDGGQPARVDPTQVRSYLLMGGVTHERTEADRDAQEYKEISQA